MAITNSPLFWYNNAVKSLDISTLLTNDIKVILLNNLYTPDSVNHLYYDVDITNELATGLGYTSGGQSLTSKTVTEVVPGKFVFTSANPSWTATGGSLIFHSYVIYDNTPATNKPLIGFSYPNYNSGVPLDLTVLATVPFQILLPTDGWLYLQKVDGI